MKTILSAIYVEESKKKKKCNIYAYNFEKSLRNTYFNFLIKLKRTRKNSTGNVSCSLFILISSFSASSFEFSCTILQNFLEVNQKFFNKLHSFLIMAISVESLKNK